ncbi:MAG TPA: flavocytochrome c [Candidatus Limnocylindria bacterium]|nr:flavocytochrome c [Candidatus Limnocylindria bacterium]
MFRKLAAFALACLMMLSISAGALAQGMTPGTYTKTVKGFFEGLKVEVTLTADKIESVRVLEYNETSPGWPALTKMPEAIVAAQTIGVDTVAGATRTSEGIVEAVRQALVEAGADMDKFSAKAEVAPQAAVPYYPVMGSFELPAAWDETYDVVVVGGGFAGMAAAYAASQNGASVVLVEKLSATGGNSAINGGQYASYTSTRAAELQAASNLVPDTAEKHYEDTIKGGDFMGKPELVSAMVNAAPVYFNLLLENGLVIRPVLARPGGHYGYRTYVTENQVGSDITNLQLEMLKKTATNLQLDTRMVEIYRTRDAENRVVGIRVATADGYKAIKAEKGVILATGGFGANVGMRETQVPYLNSDIPTTNNVAAATGEGIQLAQAIGANTMQMSNIQRYPFADANNGVLDSFAVWPFTGPSFGIVYVDWQGNRYVSEGERRDVCANAAANSGFISTYSIFTRDVVSFAKDAELERGVAIGRILKGETLEELAAAINAYPIKGQFPQVSAENLKNTIEKHNSYIDSGTDPDFKKVMAATMVKMTEGPYYALSQYPSVHHTMGGLVIDRTTNVYDIFGQPIAGLYAAGEVTGGLHGTNRLGSNADADACGMGYISGIFVSTGEMPDFVPAN